MPLFGNALKLSPLLLGATLLLANRTQAAQVFVVSSIQLLAQSTSSVPAQSALEEIAAEVTPEAKIADLTQPNPTQQQVAGKPAFGGTSQPSQNTPAKDALAQVISNPVNCPQ